VIFSSTFPNYTAMPESIRIETMIAKIAAKMSDHIFRQCKKIVQMAVFVFLEISH